MELNKITLPFKIKNAVLAMGSQAKNTLCFAKGNAAFISREHANLNNPDDFLRFKRDAARLLKNKPKIIACDLHPDYQSTKCADGLPLPRLMVQHHHAHIAACMVLNNLKNQKVIGVAFDGTGMGSDDTLWGGEFLICDYKNFRRRAHLKTALLLGAEVAIKEPWRLAAFWLSEIYGDKFLKLKTDFTRKISSKEWGYLKKIQACGFNSPLTSSMGRLFDAAASIILAKMCAGKEAELAIELEKVATRCSEKVLSYDFKLSKADPAYIIDPAQLFKGIIADLKSGESKERTALRFHLSVAEMIRKVCCILRKESGINRVALSGGVFQNNLLLRLSLELLYKEEFRVLTLQKLPPNDSLISLGQAVIAGL